MPLERSTDILIIGGGVGGVAAALAATSLGKRVILTEETDWLGGQLTSQAVPPDEHQWIEKFGCTKRYRAFREGVRSTPAVGKSPGCATSRASR
jgi:NADPH-dependent 2,4-dienoyl-CoA reductase/sulfur reductase-like enzyme